ncbi:MAG: OadG-related small transporter subunit [Gemmiger sp.]|nr:OadG-related small transporter subunit [Gemmiger sp.]
MLQFSNLSATLPIMLVGMVGIFLVIGVIILAVYLLNHLFSGNKK